VPRDGGGVRISNSGTASANTGGNVVGNPPASVVTGPASATGNESSVVVGGRP
jgi:hypothetical protein